MLQSEHTPCLANAYLAGYFLPPFRRGSVMRLAFALSLAPSIIPAAAAAESCPQSSSEIATDRPDVTSLVVPKGSFQQENGVNIRQQFLRRCASQGHGYRHGGRAGAPHQRVPQQDRRQFGPVIPRQWPSLLQTQAGAPADRRVASS
jgi:hypothetical protein